MAEYRDKLLLLTTPFSNQNTGVIKIIMASLLNQNSLTFKQHLIKHTSSFKKPVPDVLDSGAIDGPKLATS